MKSYEMYSWSLDDVYYYGSIMGIHISNSETFTIVPNFALNNDAESIPHKSSKR